MNTEDINNLETRVIPEPRRDGFTRLGTVRQVLGRQAATEALELLYEQDQQNRRALRALGLSPQRGF